MNRMNGNVNVKNSCRKGIFLRTGIIITILMVMIFLRGQKVFASLGFMGNFEYVRPGESVTVDVSGSLRKGEKIKYVSSNPSVAMIDRVDKSSSGYRKLIIKGMKKGTARIQIQSNYSNGNYTEMAIRVANYKEYVGFSTYGHSGKVKYPIKKITISGNKLTINGAPIRYSRKGRKNLKKRKRTFRLTKKTYYGYGDGGLWASQGKKAKKEARKTWRAPILHVVVEGKKVIAYYSSC